MKKPMVEGLLANPSVGQETFILSEIKQALMHCCYPSEKKKCRDIDQLSPSHVGYSLCCVHWVLNLKAEI